MNRRDDGLPAELADAVQRNCDIADARHAGDAPLCIYLLQLREFYRWQQAIPLGTAPDREALGRWIAEREAMWDGLADDDFRRLRFGGSELDPLDPDEVNAALAAGGCAGLVYGAGEIGNGRQIFFLGRRADSLNRDGLSLEVVEDELARGLIAPPAALGGDTIVLRRDAMRRWLAQKAESWALQRPAGAMAELLAHYRWQDDPDAALARIVGEQSEILVLHELGERAAAADLGPDWSGFHRAWSGQRRTDLLLRAVKDHLADCLVTLPQILRSDAPAPSLHFWFSGFEGLREQLFPRLASAYQAWCRGDAGAALRAAITDGELHFAAVARTMLAVGLPDARPDRKARSIEAALASLV